MSIVAPLHYQAAGSGNRVVLLHGMGCDLHSWDSVRDGLSGRWRIITPDLPGHGQSSKRCPAYNLDMFAGSVARWLDDLKTGPVHLIGHSFGGAVAVAVALARPDLVRSVGIVSTVNVAGDRPKGKTLRAFMRFGLAQSFSRPSRGETARFVRVGFGVASEQITPKLIDYVQHSHGISRQTVWRATLATKGHNAIAIDRFREVKVPVWVFWGTHDPLFPGAERAAEIVARFPNGRLELFPSAHLAMFEQPERFRESLSTHLENAARGRP